MQRLMRKYRNIIFVFILLFIGLPMLFFGIPEFMKGQGNTTSSNIGTVGDEEISEVAFRRNLDLAAKRYGTQDKPMSYADLDKAGHVTKIMEEMVDGALIDIKQKERGFVTTDATASELLKTEFQDENGNFDQSAFDTWRDKQDERGMNWTKMYEGLHEDLSKKVFLDSVMAASYRVTADKVDKELNKKYEKLRVRYTKVTLPIELSDADIQAYYDAHQSNYQKPEQRIAQFIAVPIAAARPTKADEVFKALAEGKDFAEVADTFSDQQVKNGGDIGWQTPLDNEDAYRQKLFDLGVGEVSDLVLAPQGYFIYKVEEERTNADTGKREVKARQVFLLNPSQSEEERAAQSAEMSKFVSEANTNGIDAAATKFQFPVSVSGNFDANSETIENIPKIDAKEFRDKLLNAKPEDPFINIIGRENNYCAKVTELTPGPMKPLDEVREQVVQDLKKEKSKDDAVKKRTKAYAYKLGREVKTLDDIQKIYPGLEVDIKESRPFSAQDNLYQQGFMVVGDILFDALDGKEIGQATGPIEDFMSDYYIVELLERIPPTDEDKQKFEEGRKTEHDKLIMESKSGYLDDYRKKLRETMMANYAPDIDQVLVDEILGVNKGDEADKPKSEDSTTANDATKAGDASAAPKSNIKRLSVPSTTAPAPAAPADPAPATPAPATPAPEAPAREL